MTKLPSQNTYKSLIYHHPLHRTQRIGITTTTPSTLPSLSLLPPLPNLRNILLRGNLLLPPPLPPPQLTLQLPNLLRRPGIPAPSRRRGNIFPIRRDT